MPKMCDYCKLLLRNNLTVLLRDQAQIVQALAAQVNTLMQYKEFTGKEFPIADLNKAIENIKICGDKLRQIILMKNE